METVTVTPPHGHLTRKERQAGLKAVRALKVREREKNTVTNRLQQRDVRCWYGKNMLMKILSHQVIFNQNVEARQLEL